MSLLEMVRSRKNVKKWLDQAEETSVVVNIKDTSILEKMNMINLTEADIRIIKNIRPMVEKNVDQVVKDFYSKVLSVEHLKNMIEEHSTVEKLRKTLRIHIIEMFSGTIDQQFIEKRFRIAKIHFIIGLDPAWYMGAFQNITNTFTSIVFNEVRDRKELQAILEVINKILSFEQQIVLEAYEQENMKKLNFQFEEGKLYLKNKMTSVSEGLVALAEETQTSVENLSDHFKSVNEITIENNQQAILAKDFANEGQNKLTELLEQIGIIERYSSNMIESIHRLGESSNEISNVIHIVQDIAEQTNIIALNSAIEAARAGEHGRGFSVLSQEVQKLAEQTKNAIGQIYHLISTSNNYQKQVVESLAQVEHALQSGIATSKQTNTSFQKIVESIEQSGTTVLEVQQQMEELIHIVNGIEKATEIVASSAEQLNDAAANA